MKLNKLTAAEQDLKESLQIHRQHNSSDKAEVVNVLHNLGILYFQQQNYRQAAHYFDQNLKLRQKHLPQDKLSLGHSHISMGRLPAAAERPCRGD